MIFEHWSRSIREARQRPAGDSIGADKPVQAHLASISTLAEEALSGDYGGGRPTRITHPAMGVRAWIRFMPEEGSAAVVTQRAETGESEITYYHSSPALPKVEAYMRGQGHYRNLELGEIEVSSFGFAQAFWSHRGALHLRGGITRLWLSHDELEVGQKAATHRRLLHDHNHDGFGAEERYGVVWRKGDDHTKRKYVKFRGQFAREYARSLTFSGSPATLFDHLEGHVIDAEGEEILSPVQTPLRRRSRWYVSGGTRYVQWQIDEDGNAWWTLPKDATTGWTTKVPKGTFRVTAGQKVQLGAKQDVEITGRNVTLRARGVLHLRAGVAVNIMADGAVAIQGASVTINGRPVAASTAPI